MKLDISIIKCSGCNAWSKYLSEIQKHCSTSIKCSGQTPITKTFELEFPENEPPKCTVKRRKTGPPPLDIHSILYGRVPAFTADESDESFEQRIDYLFDTEGLLDKCITTGNVEQRIGNLFSVLYGHLAPEKFQSIIMYRGKVYAIDDTYTNGEVSFDEYPSIHRYFKDSDFFEHFLTCMLSICKTSIPTRRPDLSNHAHHIYKLINFTNVGDKLTILDALVKNDTYMKYRMKYTCTLRDAKRLSKVLVEEVAHTEMNHTA